MTANDDNTISVNRDGMVIPVSDSGRDAKYIEWNPRFEAHAAAIQRAWQAILRGSRISPVLVMPDMKVPQLATGAALRRLAIPTVARIRELRGHLEDGMRAALTGAVELLAANGNPVVRVRTEALEFEWPAPLSSGDEELPEENEDAGAGE